MIDTILAPAPFEQLRDDAKEARLAAFARLNLRTTGDLAEFVRNQEAISDSPLAKSRLG